MHLLEKPLKTAAKGHSYCRRRKQHSDENGHFCQQLQSHSRAHFGTDKSWNGSQKSEFLEPQNQARALVGLPPLQWSSSLQNYAEWWAKERQMHGKCLLRHSGGPFGENIFWGEAGRNWRPSDAVSLWVAERQWYDYRSNRCFRHACGHYTQIVWRSTRFVGCAKSVCSDGDVFIICDYFPPGNYIGQRPF